MEKLLTVKEAAKVLRTNPTYVYKLINAGLLPVLKLGCYKVREGALDAFIASHEGYDVTDPERVERLGGDAHHAEY